MDSALNLFESQPLWLPIAAAALVCVIIVVFLWILAARRTFLRQLKSLYDQPEYLQRFLSRYGREQLIRRSALIEKVAGKHGMQIVPQIGADDIWVARLRTRKGKADFLRVLEYAPQKGLFQCFLTALEKRSLAPILIKWLEDTGDFLYLRKLALAGVGEPFNGRAAYEVFLNKLDEIREMTGDPEWPSRYFAVKVILHDNDDRSQRALWDAFADPHPLIRRSVASEFHTGERESLYTRLLALSIDDPVSEVRRAAWERIHHDLLDLHTIHDKELSSEQAFHVLELLQTDSKDNENFALKFLDSDDLELRFSAARFLVRCGTLRRLCQEVDLGDRRGWKRNYDLLQKAGEVNVTSFLSQVRESQNPASLLICARMLAENGDRSLIAVLSRKVFNLYEQREELRELYQATVEAVAKRGSEEALKSLNRELQRWRNHEKAVTLLLDMLPLRGDFLFTPTLLSFLKDPDFPAKQPLREALKRMSQPAVVEGLFEVLKAERGTYAHSVRIEAIRLLGEMALHYCLQTLLENISILPIEEAKEFTRVLAKYPAKLFKEKVIHLLEGPDAKVRAALIAALSASGEREFLKSIKTALKDADPDVRIASVWSLVEYQDYRTLSQSVGMLRDPVERVREAVARALGSYGSDDALGKLKEILFDGNEIQSVKWAAAQGLGFSQSLVSIDILLEKLEKDEELTGAIEDALGHKLDKKSMTHLIDRFKDASPSLRQSISSAFRAMKDKGEPAIVELMREDIPSLRPFIGEILERTGHIEAQIRKLAHRDPLVRRGAAEFLSLVGTQSAFRGIVLAARDPDEDVRVRVIKALEHLETAEGHEILQALEQDPDRRVRKYTLWALERLRAKAL
ncbi:MAG: HEAT repeat domain-containing protein [Spirochaetaceae bacterium]|nr:MAG: HEAT repeat domain-containing protein [Spirochaetaceae bacterium]